MNGHSISNWLLFMAAALWAIGLAIGLTFDFFKNESRVSAEIVLLGLGFIAAYAGNNKLFKASCGKNGGAKPRAKPGEWVFAFLVVWAVAMATLYHTNALWYWREKEISVPGNFVLFMGGVLTIFTGTKLWDGFSSIRRTNNNK